MLQSVSAGFVAEYFHRPDQPLHLPLFAVSILSCLNNYFFPNLAKRVSLNHKGVGIEFILLFFISAQRVPFRVQFVTDSTEAIGAAAANTNELDQHPGGIVGFSLNFVQNNC